MDKKDTGLVSAEEAQDRLNAIQYANPDEVYYHYPTVLRTVIALHKRLEGVGVVEFLAARDAATRERERADKAERERDEAIDLLEGIPTWGPYRWRDVPETVRLKLRGNSDQIGRLIKERDAARTILDGEFRARSKCERERDEARAQIAAVQALSNHPKGTPAETVHDLLCESERLYDMAVSERDEARAERDRLRDKLAHAVALHDDVLRDMVDARAERDRLRDVVEHAARTGSDATFRVAVCKGAGSGEKLALVVTGPADREENMARSVAGLICATMSLAMDERDVELRDAVAERDHLRHLRDIVAEEHEDCEQYAAWLANPVRVGRCHVCDLLNTAADAAQEVTRG